MQPVTNQVEYIFPENEFGTYPDVEEVSDANIAGNNSMLQINAEYVVCQLGRTTPYLTSTAFSDWPYYHTVIALIAACESLQIIKAGAAASTKRQKHKAKP